MSRVVSFTSAVTVNPSSYSDVTFTSSYYRDIENGYNSTANASSYARFTMRNTSYHIYYNFASINIPSEATINSVSCSVKGYVQNASYYPSVQLYAGSTAKGNSVNITSNSSSNVSSISNTGTWTASELENASLYISVAVANTRQSRYFYFYGADLTVNYTVSGTEYEVSFNNQSYDITTDPSTTQYVFQDDNQEINFYGITDVSDIVVKDNNTDVTSSLVSVPGGNNIASVGTINGVTYGFTTSGNGYCSTNKGQARTVSMCRLNITATSECVLNLYVINYAEATYDYGIIGKLDTSLITTTATSDSSSWYWAGSASSQNVSTEQLVQISIPSGSHYIDIKFRKDTYTDDNNDSLWFRYEIEPDTVEACYKYTLSNISADHIISIDDATGGTYYEVNASSTYTGATVSPSTQSIREGRNANVNITVANLYEIVVKDNNVDVTSSVTGTTGNYVYTVSNVQTAHTITVEENTNYSVTVNSTYTGATGTANPTKVYQGQSSVIDIDVDNLYEIVVKDNGTDVTSSLVQTQSEQTSITLNPAEFVSSASSYSGVYNNYNTENGLTNSGSTTRTCVYSNTGSGVESKLTYKFDCSSIPQNAVITSVICYVKCSVYQTSYFSTRTVQLYNGNVAKGTATTITDTGSNGALTTTNGGNWTRDELNDIAIVERVVRGTSSTSSDASFSFWGADLVISYTTPDSCTYTINNVNENHVITIEEATNYAITTTNTYTGSTITAPSKVYSGQNATISINVSNLYEVVVTDNNIDITNSFTGSNGVYSYTLTNVNANHTISVVEAPYATVSVVSYYSSITGSPASQKVYLGRNATITFNGSINGIVIKDGETDITSSVSQNTYTISNVQTDHTIYIYREVNYIKQNGAFAEIKIYYRKVNDSWTTITKSEFEAIATANTMSYEGYFSGITSIGEVVDETKDITINDGQLQSGTYKLVYVDENGDPLTNYDKITEFTIS